MQKKLLQTQNLNKVAASTRALNSAVKAAKAVDSEKEPIYPSHPIPPPAQPLQFLPGSSIFAHDSTYSLLKKYTMGKLMSSNFFINHALRMMHLSYKCLGLGLTNFVIGRTVGPVYTSGPDIPSMMQDVRAHESRNINALVGYVVEGLEDMDEELVEGYLEEMIRSVVAHCHGKPEGHYALKYTALVTV
jgi:hypothetical protein